MAINRFDRPAESNYFNTLAPLPYNEIMNTVASRQAQLQASQAQMDAMYEQSQLFNAIPGSRDEEEIKDLQNFVQDWSNKWWSEDMSDPIVMRQAMNEYRSKIDRPFIKDAESSYQAWRTNQEVKRRYQAEGKYNELLDDDPATGWSSRDGIYQHMTPAALASRPVAESYFNNIRGSVLTDSRGNSLKDSDGYTKIGVTQSDINRVINERWRDFADTPEGRQAVTLAAKRMGIDPKDLDKSDIKAIATDILSDVGKEYTWTDITGSRDPRSSGSGASGSLYGGNLPKNVLGIEQEVGKERNFNKEERVLQQTESQIAELDRQLYEYENNMPTKFANEEEYLLAKDTRDQMMADFQARSIQYDETKERVDNEMQSQKDKIFNSFQNNLNSNVSSGLIDRFEADRLLDMMYSLYSGDSKKQSEYGNFEELKDNKYFKELMNFESEKNKRYNEQFKDLDPSVIQDKYFVSPNYKRDLESGQYTAVIKSGDGTDQVRVASGLGRVISDLGVNYEGYKVEKISDEVSSSSRGDARTVRRLSEEDQKKLILTAINQGQIKPIGTSMKRNNDGSFSFYIAPSIDDVTKGKFKVTIPVGNEDLIDEVVNDLTIQKPYSLEMANDGSLYQYVNPEVYRLKVPIDATFYSNRGKESFDIQIASDSFMKVEKKKDGYIIYHTNGQPINPNNPYDKEDAIKLVTKYASLAATGFNLQMR